jgi:hypothetical protein
MSQEYGELMRFLMYFRERYDSEEAFRDFVRSSLQELVKDLRDLDLILSIHPECLRRPVSEPKPMPLPNTMKAIKTTGATLLPGKGG